MSTRTLTCLIHQSISQTHLLFQLSIHNLHANQTSLHFIQFNYCFYNIVYYFNHTYLLLKKQRHLCIRWTFAGNLAGFLDSLSGVLKPNLAFTLFFYSFSTSILRYDFYMKKGQLKYYENFENMVEKERNANYSHVSSS